MKIVILTCLFVGVVYSTPARRGLLSEILRPFEEVFEHTEEELKPYVLDLLVHHHLETKRNAISNLLAPIKEGLKQTKDQLKPYLHTVGKTLENQLKTTGIAAISKGISDVVTNLFKHLFHIHTREDPLEAIEEGFEKTVQEVKPYLKQVEHSLLSESEKQLLTGFEHSFFDLVSEALTKIVHHNNFNVDIDEIKEFARRFSSIVHKKIGQLSEFLDQVSNEFHKVSSKLSQSLVTAEKAVHDIDAIVAQHRITGDIILKYLGRDLKELLTSGSAPAIFEDVIHKTQNMFQSMFNHLKQMAEEEGHSLKKAAMELIQ